MRRPASTSTDGRAPPARPDAPAGGEGRQRPHHHARRRAPSAAASRRSPPTSRPRASRAGARSCWSPPAPSPPAWPASALPAAAALDARRSRRRRRSGSRRSCGTTSRRSSGTASPVGQVLLTGAGHQRSRALPERPQHAAGAAELRRAADRQRERHGGGRGDQGRRQRQPGRPGRHADRRRSARAAHRRGRALHRRIRAAIRRPAARDGRGRHRRDRRGLVLGRGRQRARWAAWRTKLQAAQKAAARRRAHDDRERRGPGALDRLLGGEPLGTYFAPGTDRLAARKRWIAFAVPPQGRLTVDAGAAGP